MNAVLGAAGVIAATLTLALPASAQYANGETNRISLEARGAVAVPTFDIADAAKTGPAFGLGIGYSIAPRWWVLADADAGFHPAKTSAGSDVNVYHYMGKLGFDLVPPGTSRWSLLVNAGAGAMTFDIRAPGAPTKTYFGINVGAKIGYALTENVDLLLSPQGDIAFTDTAVLGTGNSWVWPFTAGVRLRL